MTEQHPSSASGIGGAGWLVGQSIGLELDVALTAVRGQYLLGEMSPDLTQLAYAVSSDWLAEGMDLLGRGQGFVSTLSILASLSGMLLETDYSRATLAMRELTADEAWQRLLQQEGAGDEPMPGDLSVERASAPEALVALAARLTLRSYRRVGLEPTALPTHERGLREEFGRAIRFLRDGDRHSRFWHWLDRFYYEAYHPWRSTRLDVLAMMEQHAVAMLGARDQRDGVPTLDWLPPQNPLRLRAELQAAVLAGRLRVLFWVEPFGMADVMHLEPDLLCVSFAAPGPIYRSFLDFAGDVAARSKALADPTRLIILRLIRSFSMTSTEMAEFLEIARPTASIHAKILREAGLITSWQEGREVHHTIVASEVRRLFSDLQRFLDLPAEAGTEGVPDDESLRLESLPRRGND